MKSLFNLLILYVRFGTWALRFLYFRYKTSGLFPMVEFFKSVFILLILLHRKLACKFLWLAMLPLLLCQGDAACGDAAWWTSDRLRWPLLKRLFTHTLPIRKWGRNSEFRFDLHPRQALFFCCYWETQWGCVCGGEITVSVAQLMVRGGRWCRLLCALSSSLDKWYSAAWRCARLHASARNTHPSCRVRGLWVLPVSLRLWGWLSAPGSPSTIALGSEVTVV